VIYYSEKQFLKQLHQKDLLKAGETWNDDPVKIQEMVKKYHHVQYTPLISKKIEVPQEFVDWFFEHAQLNSNPFPDFNHTWLSVYKKADYDFQYHGTAKNKDLSHYPDIKEMYVYLFDQLEDILPYKSLESFNISSNVKNVVLHRDPLLLISLPISFRVMLYDENTVGTYHHVQYRPTNEVFEFNDNDYVDQGSFRNGVLGKSTIHDPKNGPFFTYNNLTVKHSADKHDNAKKILFIPRITNPIEWDKFEELMDKSLKKYKESCMLDDLPLSDYFGDSNDIN